MVRDYNYLPNAGMPLAEFLYLTALFAATLAPPALHAGLPPEIEPYTLQREKTAEFAASTLQTGEAPEIEITEQSDAYRIKAVAVIAAPAHCVRYVLTDYIHIYRLNPSIIESEVLRQDDGSVSVRTRVLGCAAYFCEEFDRVEKVQLLPSGDLFAEIIPELSEFKSGQTYWRIRALDDDHSEVSYLSDIEPDVFIPPVVGKFLIKKSIRKEMQISFTNLEKIASVLAEREWREDYQPAVTMASGFPCHTINNSQPGAEE